MNELKIGQYRQDNREFIIQLLKVFENGQYSVRIVYHYINDYGANTECVVTYSSHYIKKRYPLVLNGYNTPLYNAINGEVNG